jgi:hypothetical protein
MVKGNVFESSQSNLSGIETHMLQDMGNENCTFWALQRVLARKALEVYSYRFF